MNDPVIVYESAEDSAPKEGNGVYQDIQAARLQQNSETPLDNRIQYATWPEVVVYFSTLTMDEQYVSKDVKELYQFSFREYVDDWRDMDTDSAPSPLDEDPVLKESQRNRLDDLRFGIKKDRDRYFVENEYEVLSPDSVPEEFWLTDYELGREVDDLDEMAQSALQDYL